MVATGGFGKVIADETDVIDIYDNILTLQGCALFIIKICGCRKEEQEIQN